MRLDLYVVTDERLSHGLSHAEIAVRAARGGADAVQLRDKTMSSRQLYQVAVAIRQALQGTGVLFIVNDRADVALAAGADGVHLGQDDLPLREVRRIAPPGFLIGVSVGDVAQAQVAERDGADYVALSPLFDTGSKFDAGAGRGLEMLSRIKGSVSLPLLAIGGIDLGNVCQVIAAGADGVAVVSAVVSQADVTVAARKMKDEVRRCKQGLQGASSPSGT